MTKDELRAKFEVAYKIVKRERTFWAEVADKGQVKALEKIQEMDRLLEVVTELKDELKARMEREAEQPKLLDVPRRASYE